MTTDTTDRQLVWLALAIVAALVALPAFTMGFGTMGTGSMMGGMGSGGMWGAGGSFGWMLGGAGMLIFLALVIGIASLSYRALTTQDGGTDTALEELRVAYARGDLSDEEYEQRRTRLETES
jgi:putative membrane protein